MDSLRDGSARQTQAVTLALGLALALARVGSHLRALVAELVAGGNIMREREWRIEN